MALKEQNPITAALKKNQHHPKKTKIKQSKI